MAKALANKLELKENMSKLLFAAFKTIGNQHKFKDSKMFIVQRATPAVRSCHAVEAKRFDRSHSQ